MTNKSHIPYGLVSGLAMVVLSVIIYVLKLYSQSWLSWISILILFIGVILSCTNYAKINGGNVTFGNVFSNGFKTAAIAAIITVAVAVLMLFVFPDMKETAMEMARAQMEKQGQSEEVIEKGLEVTRKMYGVFVIGGQLFSVMFFGAIASLIGAAIAKKNPVSGPPQL